MPTRFASAFSFALLLAATALPGMAADLPKHPFIHVNAGAEVYLMPDIGEVDIEIVSYEADADAAWKIINEQLEAGRALFARHGVAPEDLLVQDIVRRPRKAEPPAEGQPVAMETRVAVHATVRDIAQWTPLLRGLLVMKNIESLAVAFNRSDRDKVESELLAEALGSARLKAQEIARGVGARLGPATGVTPGALKNLSNAMGMASDAFGRNSGADRRSSPREDMSLVQAMRLAQGVDVIYKIGGK